MAGETVSTKAVQDWLRTRLLTFPAPIGGAKVQDIVGDRIYWDRPPADVGYPFGILRLSTRPGTTNFQGERLEGSLELSLIARPAGTAEVDALNQAGDLAQGALVHARVGDSAAATTGLIFVGESTRDPLPPPIEPVDEQTYQVRILWTLTLWPRYLTQYAHP